MPPKQPRFSLKKIIAAGAILVVIAIIIGILVIKKNESSDSQAPAKNLFPYGTTSSGGSTGTVANVGDQQGTVPTPTNPLSLAGADLLRELANYPVTDYYAWTSGAPNSENFIRWNAKQTGILEQAQVDLTTIVETQKTKTRVPLASELWFGNFGNAVIYRTWNGTNRSIDTLAGTVPTAGSIAYCQTTFGADLKRGSKNSDVKALQIYVNYKMHLGLSTDGSYGAKLAAAVKALQKQMQLPQTGLFDDATRGAVNDDCATAITAAAVANSQPSDLSHVGFLMNNILRGSVSPDGTQMFYVVPDGRGGVNGIVSNIDGTGAHTVWNSPLTEWRPQWVNATTIAMTTLASGEAPGYLYFLNIKTGDFRKIIGPATGLTTLVSPDGATVMISQSTAAGITTGFYSVANGSYKPSDLATLPEKCSWSSSSAVICGVPQSIQSGTYPDDWYQGTATFSDALWSIDISTGTTTNILTPPQPFDMIHVRTSPDGAYAYFINKTDGTLWSYRLK